MNATPCPFSPQSRVVAYLRDSGGDCNIDYNCSDFTTHADAQTCFVHCGGTASNNFANLDGSDHDGKVCELLP